MQIHSITDNRPPSFYAALLVITLVPLYYASYRYELTHPYGGTIASKHRLSTSAPADFVRNWLDAHLISSFNPSPIVAYCNRTEWHPNLIFTLDNANGGIGNVRGNVLDFIFFAIEAGASIILPSRATRAQKDISNVWASHASFHTFFDEEWFLHAMSQACPQMSIYNPEKNKAMVDPLPGNYLPRSRRVDIDTTNTREAYLSHLSDWLKAQPTFNPNNITVVSLERTLWDIDTRSLPPGFRRSFGALLRINPSIRRYAGLVVQNMKTKYHLVLAASDHIPPLAFYGAHLRTENDARNAGWLEDQYTNFTAQTDAYIQQAVKQKLKVVYVASGNATELARFKRKASRHIPPLNVTEKFELLPSKEAAALRKFSWDQQALVDYEVLQRCSVFGGIVKSSFAYSVAMTRDQRLVDEGRVGDPWAVLHAEEGVAFDDGVSRVVGRDGWHEGRIPRGMWP